MSPKLDFQIDSKTLKKLLVIPILLLLLSLSFLLYTNSQTGEFLSRGIDLQGGVQLTIHYTKAVNNRDFESSLRNSLGTTEVDVVSTTNPATRKQENLIISVGGEIQESAIVDAIESYLDIELEPTKYSVRALGPALAGTFWKQAKWALIFAFIFMAFMVFFTYKQVAPSIAIIVSTLYDLGIIIGFMSILHINLTLPTIAAMLMIIGYGVDTNILLSTKILKEKSGEALARVKTAAKTGLTMSATTISTLVALFIIANSLVLKQIAGVLIIGLLADIPNTWILNANLLLWLRKRKE